MDIPRIGMGTYGMGGKFINNKFNIDRDNCFNSIQMLREGLDLGFRLIDTAELYGDGLVEEIVGKAVAGYQREDIFIITKAWKDNLRHDDLIHSAMESKKRLNTAYIDLYLIHHPNPNIDISETMSALEYLVDEGHIRHIGISNFSASLLEKAQRYLRNNKIFANEIEYNLLSRAAEKDIIPFCKNENIKIIAYRPLAKGLINNLHCAAIDEMAKKYQKTPVQIALNWIISQGIIPIFKASNIFHLMENCGANDWTMERKDIEFLRNNLDAKI